MSGAVGRRELVDDRREAAAIERPVDRRLQPFERRAGVVEPRVLLYVRRRRELERVEVVEIRVQRLGVMQLHDGRIVRRRKRLPHGDRTEVMDRATAARDEGRRAEQRESSAC